MLMCIFLSEKTEMPALLEKLKLWKREEFASMNYQSTVDLSVLDSFSQ